jgi:hypothetical protein
MNPEDLSLDRLAEAAAAVTLTSALGPAPADRRDDRDVRRPVCAPG